MVGMTSGTGIPLQKQFTIVRNDREFHERMHILCDGSHGHRDLEQPDPVTETFLNQAMCPEKMVENIAALWKSQYMNLRKENEATHVIAAAQQIENDDVVNQDVPDGAEVTGKMREQGRALLTRLHKAAGHPSNRALARICRDCGMPKWVVDLALNLRCQACLGTKRGGAMVVPHSVGTMPQPWQMLGMDVFELIFPQQKRKARYLLAICLVMRLVMVEILWEGPMNESGTDRLVDTFAASWPKPEWILTDPQSSLAKGDFAEFCGWIGCGLATTPGEAHWQNGAVETAVKAVKKTMKRLRNESTELSATLCGHLAASAHNQMEVVKGFSPTQWAFGSDPSAWRQDADPLEVNKRRGERLESFWRWRARAEVAMLEPPVLPEGRVSVSRAPPYGDARRKSFEWKASRR